LVNKLLFVIMIVLTENSIGGVYYMLNLQTVLQIEQVSITEHIHLIELILQSVKHDIKLKSLEKNKKFVVRKFSLGKEVDVDRDELYAERIVF
jgi:hypothetical protein